MMEPILRPVQQKIFVQLWMTMMWTPLSASMDWIQSAWLYTDTSLHRGPNQGNMLSSSTT